GPCRGPPRSRVALAWRKRRRPRRPLSVAADGPARCANSHVASWLHLQRLVPETHFLLSHSIHAAVAANNKNLRRVAADDPAARQTIERMGRGDARLTAWRGCPTVSAKGQVAQLVERRTENP